MKLIAGYYWATYIGPTARPTAPEVISIDDQGLLWSFGHEYSSCYDDFIIGAIIEPPTLDCNNEHADARAAWEAKYCQDDTH